MQTKVGLDWPATRTAGFWSLTPDVSSGHFPWLPTRLVRWTSLTFPSMHKAAPSVLAPGFTMSRSWIYLWAKWICQSSHPTQSLTFSMCRSKGWLLNTKSWRVSIHRSSWPLPSSADLCTMPTQSLRQRSSSASWPCLASCCHATMETKWALV